MNGTVKDLLSLQIAANLEHNSFQLEWFPKNHISKQIFISTS